MSKNTKTQVPTHDEIAARAQAIYEREGRQQGRAMQNWLQAEAQLIAERKADPSAATTQKPSSPAPQGKLRGNDWQTTGRTNLHSN